MLSKIQIMGDILRKFLSLSRDAKVEIRRRAVTLVRKQNYPVHEVASILEVTKVSIYNWLKRYDFGGMPSLIAKKQWGRPPTLNKSQSAKLIQILRSFDPTHFGLPSKLWNRSSIVHVVRSEMKIEMHPEAVSRFLKKHNFTFHKPVRRAYQQDKGSVAEWVSKTFPKIKARAKKKEQACTLGMKAGSSFVTPTGKAGRRRVRRGS